MTNIHNFNNNNNTRAATVKLWTTSRRQCCAHRGPSLIGCQHLRASSVSMWSTGRCRRSTRLLCNQPIHTTPRTKRPHLASSVCSQHPRSRGSIRSSKVRRQEAGQTDPHTLAEWQESHLGCHHHRHSRAVVSASDVGVVWKGQWRWRQRESQHSTYSWLRHTPLSR